MCVSAKGGQLLSPTGDERSMRMWVHHRQPAQMTACPAVNSALLGAECERASQSPWKMKFEIILVENKVF